MSQPQPPQDAPDSPSESTPVDPVRRRLLLAGGLYVAPAVLASFALGQEAYGACKPYFAPCSPLQSCRPANCDPVVAPCAPIQGG